MIDLQKICLKILTDAPVTLNLDPFLAIFGRWRAEPSHPAQWVDLADYAHMPRGPGIVLIGKTCNFSFDMGGAAPGIQYCSKKGLVGSLEDRLRRVFRDCFEMAGRLAAEPEFPAQVRLQSGWLELTFNDRLEIPNSPATDRELRPAVISLLDQVFGPGAYELRLEPDPGRRYGFTIRAAGSPALEVLASSLAA